MELLELPTMGPTLAHFFRALSRKLAVVFGCVLCVASHAGTTAYTYDVHGQVKTVTAPNGLDESVTAYEYDNSGNRTSVVVTVLDHTPPPAPTGLAVNPLAYNQMQLSWTATLDVGGAPVPHYKVYRGGSNIASPGGPPYNDSSVVGNTPYSYTVSAVDSAGNESAQSSSASATTPPAPDLTPPSTPTNLQGVAVSGTWASLTWSPSTDTGGSGLAGYEIFRDGGSTPIGTSSVASYSDQTVTPASTHLYKVSAYDVGGNHSGFSNQVSVTTPDTVAPSAPGSLAFSSITNSGATATWAAATDNVGVASYRYSLNGGASWAEVGDVLSVNLTGLAGATSYTMLVQARDVAGNWGPSSSGLFTTTSTYTTDSMTYAIVPLGLSGTVAYAMGVPTPNTLSDGKPISALQLANDLLTNQTQIFFVLGGFSADPGAGWLNGISLGATNFPESAAFRSCSSGSCTWIWGYIGGLPAPGTMTVTHR